MRTDLDILGEPSVYPGHPVTAAYLITKAFGSFEEADAPTCHGWPQAVGDERIPGAGGPVYSAMDFLQKLHKGSTFEDAVAWARARWDSETEHAYRDKREAGHTQAEKVLPLFDPLWWVPRERGAVLDRTRTYRYRLWRPTGSGLGTCAFVMLNPSTADENTDDATIRKCVKYARTWGYARLVVVNLFAYRTKDPAELEKIKDREKAVGRDNDAFLEQVCSGFGDWSADLVVAAWGGHGKHLDRDHVVLERLKASKRPLHYLKLSTSARKSPYHPLYLKDDLRPLPL